MMDVLVRRGNVDTNGDTRDALHRKGHGRTQEAPSANQGERPQEKSNLPTP